MRQITCNHTGLICISSHFEAQTQEYTSVSFLSIAADAISFTIIAYNAINPFTDMMYDICAYSGFRCAIMACGHSHPTPVGRAISQFLCGLCRYQISQFLEAEILYCSSKTGRYYFLIGNIQLSFDSSFA